jgi:hypothetical protein
LNVQIKTLKKNNLLKFKTIKISNSKKNNLNININRDILKRIVNKEKAGK